MFQTGSSPTGPLPSYDSVLGDCETKCDAEAILLTGTERRQKGRRMSEARNPGMHRYSPAPCLVLHGLVDTTHPTEGMALQWAFDPTESRAPTEGEA